MTYVVDAPLKPNKQTRGSIYELWCYNNQAHPNLPYSLGYHIPYHPQHAYLPTYRHLHGRKGMGKFLLKVRVPFHAQILMVMMLFDMLIPKMIFFSGANKKSS